MIKLKFSLSGYPVIQASFAWLRRNILILLAILLCLSFVITYVIIDNSTSNFAMKPKRMMTLLIINVTLISLVIAIISMRIYRLWSTLRSGGGSRLQKRIVIMFSLVTITPAIIVSIFSALFFNIGIQSWFNERVQRTVEESRAVSEAYLIEHKDNIRADAIAMASDLNQVADLAIANPQEFDATVAAQAALRVLTEAVVIQRNHIIAQGRLSFALAFEAIPQDVLERAAKGEAVIMTTEDDKVRVLIKIPDIIDGYLLVGRLLDSKVVGHVQNAQGAVSEYEHLKNQLDRLQLTFSIVFITLALLLLISSVWYGMVFAARLTRPIRHLVRAAEKVRGGDYSFRIEDISSDDELGTLSRSFNRMTEKLESQRGELMEAHRNEAWADVARRVAHEIKNPLTPIQLSAERIKRKYLPFITEDADNFIKYTDVITKNVADIGKMVDEFVAFAKMPTSRFADEDILVIVRKSVFSAQVAHPNYEFVPELPDKPIIFKCDERQITQVMTNLLKNAAESIEECGQREEKGRVKVSVNSDNETLNIIVEDNGIGFACINGDINKMLEPYITTREKGTGLGLSIVKKIVEDHKGLIKIENNLGNDSNNNFCGGAKVTVSFSFL